MSEPDISHSFHYGLVSVVMWSCGKDMGVHMGVANSVRHGSYDSVRLLSFWALLEQAMPGNLTGKDPSALDK